MRLLTINIQHGGGSRVARLLDFVISASPDVTVLSEYRENDRGRAIRAGLFSSGYCWQAASSIEPRENCVFIASTQPFVVTRCDQQLLAARFAGIDVVGVYFPQNEAKRPVFDRLRQEIVPTLATRAVVMGDFNTGRPYEDETADTFFCADCFDQLLEAGLIDTWRKRNPTAREFTWISRAGNGFRVDHALCSEDLDSKVSTVQYLHTCRTPGITDHSGLLLEYDA